MLSTSAYVLSSLSVLPEYWTPISRAFFRGGRAGLGRVTIEGREVVLIRTILEGSGIVAEVIWSLFLLGHSRCLSSGQ